MLRARSPPPSASLRHSTPAHDEHGASLRAPRRFPEVIVHGLGAALVPAVQVALEVQRLSPPGRYTIGVRTETVRLYDDIVPVDEVRATPALPPSVFGRAWARTIRPPATGKGPFALTHTLLPPPHTHTHARRNERCGAQDEDIAVEERSNSGVIITVRRSA